MTTVGVGGAKTRLSELLRRVERGEEIVIERGGTPVARLVPEQPSRRVLGQLRGQIRIGENFDLHRDPFDRLRVAQAQRRGLTLVSADRMLNTYQISGLAV